MTLSFAQACLAKLLPWLIPFCHRLQVAGSIRRARPEVGDIDLVAIPKLEETRDLLGAVTHTRNLLFAEITRRICHEPGWSVLKGGHEVEDDSLMFLAKGIQVDIWCATPETWGTVLLCRTGSKEHNIWLCQRAKDAGGHWHPHKGLSLRTGLASQAPIAATEEAIYSALDIPYLEPARREPEYLLPRISPIIPMPPLTPNSEISNLKSEINSLPADTTDYAETFGGTL